MKHSAGIQRILMSAVVAGYGCFAALSAGAGSVIPVRVTGEVRYAVPRKCLSPAMSLREIGDATITAESGQIYNIVMDRNGVEFSIIMNMEAVEVIGTVSERDDGKWLTVLGYAEPGMEAAHEYWRRMCCNECALSSALVNSTQPRRLHGAQSTYGRYYPLREKISAWSCDSVNMWIAADNRIIRISLLNKAVVRTYDRRQGLPEGAIYQVFSNGRTVWIVHMGGVAALAIEDGRIVDLPDLNAGFGVVCGDERNAWFIAESGTFRLDDPVRTYPAIPTAKRIRKAVDKGIWLPHWKPATGRFAANPVAINGRLFVESFGDVYKFDSGEWGRIARNSSELRAGRDSAWFLSNKGAEEYDISTGKRNSYTPLQISDGRYSHLLVTDKAVWVASEPSSFDQESSSGGLARLDLATREWSSWKEINGVGASHVNVLKPDGNAIWAVIASGTNGVKAADPGMLHIKRRQFDTRIFHIHRFDEQVRRWESVPLEQTELEPRLICGHDGSSVTAGIFPQSIDGISVGQNRIFASCRFFPEGYFTGYWPCISRIARRSGGGWTGGFQQCPEELNLQGEQPLILNISNNGRVILPAVGQDDVLDIFRCGDDHWAVTEGCVGYFDGAAEQWVKVYESGYSFYWRATAAFDDGKALYVGSDRGIVSMLDFGTGRFRTVAALKNRSISGIARNEAGNLVVSSEPAPMGLFPAHLYSKVRETDCDALEFDGAKWRRCRNIVLPESGRAEWFFRQIDKRHNRDKSDGNFLWRHDSDTGRSAPVFYLKGVFYPLVLCASEDGERLWISTFTGLVKLDIAEF